MSDEIPDNQSKTSDPQKGVLNKENFNKEILNKEILNKEAHEKGISIEETHERNVNVNASSTVPAFDVDNDKSISKEEKNSIFNELHESKKNSSSKIFENTIQESLLLGIQESLEALFDMGFSQNSTQQSYESKKPNVTVVEGGKSDNKIHEHKEPAIEAEKKRGDDEQKIFNVSSNQKRNEDIATEARQEKPSFLEIVRNDDSIENDDQQTQNAKEVQKDREDEEGQEETLSESTINDLQDHIQNMLQNPATGGQQFDIPNIDLSHLGIDNVEVRVINAGEMDDISQIQDLLGQIYDDSSAREEPFSKDKKPSFDVFTQDDVLSFEERKGSISQEQQKKRADVDSQNIASIPDGTIFVNRNDHQKIYYGLKPKNYRIFCEVGTITILLYERPEYRDVHDDYDLIESTLATLTTGQSIDVEHVHIAVVGHDDTTSKGRYFQL